MSQDEIKPHMELEADRVSVRRGRRARRLGMFAVLFFTASLWFAENYLRYERHETQFIMSLTLLDPSARAILRNVVRQETEGGGEVNPAYVEALASIEEEELVLERYQEAYELNTNSWSLVLDYGTRLFLNGKSADARQRFREAGVQDPDNVLPRYLEAAALAVSAAEDAELDEALAIIARANVSDSAKVRFPEPVWHGSLPRRGTWYQQKQSQIVDRCCAPLYRFKNLIEARVRADGQTKRYEWMDWLKTISAMGERLVDGGGAPVHMNQAVAGIQIQMDMLGLQSWLAEQAQIAPPENAEQRKAQLREALDKLNTFERGRKERVERMEDLLKQPLYSFLISAALLVGLVIAASIVGRVLGAQRFGREFAPHAWAMTIPFILFLLFSGGLSAYSMLATRGADATYALELTLAWYLVTLAGMVVGFWAPLTYLPSAAAIARGMMPGTEVPPAWRLRMGTWCNLVQRAWEDQLAALIFAGCAWVVVSRIALGAYPFQLDLLAPAFEIEAAEVVKSVAASLGAGGA